MLNPTVSSNFQSGPWLCSYSLRKLSKFRPKLCRSQFKLNSRLPIKLLEVPQIAHRHAPPAFTIETRLRKFQTLISPQPGIMRIWYAYGQHQNIKTYPFILKYCIIPLANCSHSTPLALNRILKWEYWDASLGIICHGSVNGIWLTVIHV